MPLAARGRGPSPSDMIYFMTYIMASAVTGPATPINAITPINTSLGTIPTGYFGGAKNGTRSGGDIAQLAKMRLVWIEKWEGPCWDECLKASSATPPRPCSSTCSEEVYQLDTIRRIKQANPSVAAAFYLNSLYDFPYYNLTAEFTAQDLHLRDVHGAVIGMQNDNGMLHIPVFDWGKPAAVKLFLDFHRRLVALGVSGTFPDKPNVYAFRANTTWWLCENPNGPPGGHSWANACGQITAAQASAYNRGKDTLLAGLYQIYGRDGALGCTSGRPAPGVAWPVAFGHLGGGDPIEEHAAVQRTLTNSTYIYFMKGDSGTTAMTCGCTPDDVIRFLLVLEAGAILGCNGVGPSTKHPVPPVDWWDRPLGAPLGPPQLWGELVVRSFQSGAVVRYDPQTGSGSIQWAGEPPPPPPPPSPAPPPSPVPVPVPVLPRRCGVVLVNWGIGQHDLGKTAVTGSCAECCARCGTLPACVAWAWHAEQARECHLHGLGATKSTTKHIGCVSGFLTNKTK